MKKIIIDCRRVFDSGIGRVTEWFVQNVAEVLSQEYVVNYLVTPQTIEDYCLSVEDCLVINHKPLSGGEMYLIPQLLIDNGCDLFISPQINVSPFHLCKTINMLHDLWYLSHPEFLPKVQDAQKRFGSSGDSYIKQVALWLNEDRAKYYLTEEGINLWHQALTTRNPALLYTWSQLSLFSAFSSTIVCVTKDVEHKFRALFKRDFGITTIENSMSETWFSDRQDNVEKEGFLCLAKLEERKNLIGLLNAYELYCKQVENPHSLTIAGDYGYEQYAKKVLSKIEELNDKFGCKRIQYFRSARTEQIHQLLGHAAMLIHPSLYESFGYPPLEAMAAGIPVAATKTGKMAGPLGENAVLFDPNNVEMLASIMSDFTKQPQPFLERAKKAKEALKRSIDNRQKVCFWKATIDRVLLP